MANSGDKIRIAPDEVCAEPVQRIVIADLGMVREHSNSAAEAGLNVLPRKLPLARVAILLMLVLLSVAVCLYHFAPHRTWLENVANVAEASVVRIQTNDGFGSGFVVASHGTRHLVCTNRHVVTVREGLIFKAATIPEKCQVVLHSGEVVVGRLAGLPRDPNIDLALVVIEADNLKPLRIGGFENVRVGANVAAIGHPEGLDYTTTSGIISAKREGLLLQTSTPINHGNSGGPLFNEEGRVIGVNTFILRKDFAEGIAFAIRADFVMEPNNWDCREDVSDLVERVSH